MIEDDAAARTMLAQNHWSSLPTSLIATCTRTVRATGSDVFDRPSCLPGGTDWRGPPSAAGHFGLGVLVENAEAILESGSRILGHLGARYRAARRFHPMARWAACFKKGVSDGSQGKRDR
jgi:hypothetical protein